MNRTEITQKNIKKFSYKQIAKILEIIKFILLVYQPKILFFTIKKYSENLA